MQIISLLILITFLLFLFLSRKEKVDSGENIPSVLHPFYRMTVFLYHRFFYEKLHGRKTRRRKLPGSEKVSSYLRILNTGRKFGKQYQEYYFTKFALGFSILFIGSVFSFILSVKQEPVLKDGNRLTRGGYEEPEGEVTLRITGQKKESGGSLQIKIPSRQYTLQELEERYEAFLPILEKEMLGENQDSNQIRKDMNLTTGIQGFPFTVEWELSDYTRMNREGKLSGGDIAEEGELLELTAVISCGEFRKIYKSFIHIYPPILTQTERFLKSAREALQKSNEESKYEAEWRLPEEVAGEPVTWKEKRFGQGTLILGMSCIMAVLIFFQKDVDLKKRIKEREQELLFDYPAVVGRMTLYLNAGMTVKAAWRKAAGVSLAERQEVNAAEGRRRKEKKVKRRKYILEEMQLTCYEMDSGIPEVTAYERFGKRCALQPYIKLTTLLAQNVQKGNRVLLSRLKEETQLALLERKNKIKISAEEAGTKLLAPMMLMMAVVMILIMVPAFHSF